MISFLTRSELNHMLAKLDPDCLNCFAFPAHTEYMEAFTAEVSVIRNGVPKMMLASDTGWMYTNRNTALKQSLRMAEKYLREHRPDLLPFRCNN